MKEKITLSHLDSSGAARMVDVSHKRETLRMARAESWVKVGAEVIGILREKGGLAKGNVIETARIAGIMAAKQTSTLIPLCHSLTLDCVDIEIQFHNDSLRIESHVTTSGKTGVEMEAMTAASVASLTVYDMVKSAGKGAEIGPVRLLEKTGGKSGRWIRNEESADES